jgi:hypothetical protein
VVGHPDSPEANVKIRFNQQSLRLLYPNLLGRYQFSKERQWSVDQLRLLRTQVEIDADTRDDQDEG